VRCAALCTNNGDAHTHTHTHTHNSHTHTHTETNVSGIRRKGLGCLHKIMEKIQHAHTMVDMDTTNKTTKTKQNQEAIHGLVSAVVKSFFILAMGSKSSKNEFEKLFENAHHQSLIIAEEARKALVKSGNVPNKHQVEAKVKEGMKHWAELNKKIVASIFTKFDTDKDGLLSKQECTKLTLEALKAHKSISPQIIAKVPKTVSV